MKYRVKEPKINKYTYRTLCIRCGEEKIETQFDGLPIPRTPHSIGKPSWINCKLGAHFYYREDELEEI